MDQVEKLAARAPAGGSQASIENEILDLELDAIREERHGKIDPPVGDQLSRAVADGHVPQDEPMLVDIDLPGQVLQRKREQRVFDLVQSECRAGLVVQLGVRLSRQISNSIDACPPSVRRFAGRRRKSRRS